MRDTVGRAPGYSYKRKGSAASAAVRNSISFKIPRKQICI